VQFTASPIAQRNTDVIVTKGVGGAGIGLKEAAVTIGDHQALLEEVVWMHFKLA
jgi:hypothetical protein